MLSADHLHGFDESRYQPLDAGTLLRYLEARESVAGLLQGSRASWHAREFGDGNLNLVFLVTGAVGSVIVKQALPYVRMVGPTWPLSPTRSHFEHRALAEHCKWDRSLVPEVYDVDPDMALIVMQHLSPHQVVRKGLIAGQSYPRLGGHLGRFLARIAFHTSDLYLSADDKKRGILRFAGNTAMCRITEDVVFDEPFFDAPLNRYTAPMLDSIVRDLRADVNLKLAVQGMKDCFMNRPECLLHGDLHTGSIMATAEDTRVIDPEFACFGPLGFDLGMLLANLLMAFLAQPAFEVTAGSRQKQSRCLLDQMELLWNSFDSELELLWGVRPEAGHQGALFNRRLSVDSPGLEQAALAALRRKIWKRTVGFAGCEMIRRIVGLAHVEDFEAIADPAIRGPREIQTLQLARAMLVQRADFPSMQQLLAAAEKHL